MQQTVALRAQPLAERRFYLGFLTLILLTQLLGFARTFFLRFWFPEWAAAHGAPEPFFYFHGVVFVAWLLLLIVQAGLISARRIDVHRRLGWIGFGLAVFMVIIGIYGSLLAAGRPTGFMDVPVSPLQFLTVPLADILLFGTFVTLAIVKRRKPQTHKRFILLSSIALLDAAVARWPFAIMTAQLPIPFTVIDIFVDLFLLPIILWDIVSRGRVHPVTLWGGLAIILSQPPRYLIWETQAWLSFAAWAVGLVGQ